MTKRERVHGAACWENQRVDEARDALALRGWDRALAVTVGTAPVCPRTARAWARAARAARAIPQHILEAIKDAAYVAAQRARSRAQRWRHCVRCGGVPKMAVEVRGEGQYGGYPAFGYHPVFAAARRGSEVRYWLGPNGGSTRITGARQRACVEGCWVSLPLMMVAVAADPRPIERGKPRAWRSRLEALEPGVCWRGEVVWSADGHDYHLRPGTTPRDVTLAWTRRRALERQRERSASIIAAVVAGEINPWVGFADSVAAGNCPAGTVAFARELGYPTDLASDDLGAPAAWLLEQRDDQYTRRAVTAAALRE